MGLIDSKKRALGRGLMRVGARMLQTGYRAASIGRRLKNWIPGNTGPNSLIFGDGDMLRARARSLVRENAWAASALRSFVANAIGTGIKPQSKPGLPINEKVRKAYLRWTDEADANGQLDFYGLQSQVCKAVMRDGECFVRIRPRRITDKNARGRRLAVPLQLQVIEADHVPYSETRELEGGARILGGIELDALGRRVAYHMHRDHPGEHRFTRTTELTRIPASQILHIYRPDRPGQLRGETWFGPAIVALYELDQYVEAAVLRAKLANLLAFFIRKTSESGTVLNEEDQGDGTALAGVQPGSVHYLELGEEIVFNSPVAPGTDFQTFLRVMLRAVAAALGVTYEQLSGDLEGVNYSSIRAGALEFRRWCEAFQHQVIAFQLCNPVWDLFLQQATLAGVITPAEYEASLDVRWIAPGWPWVDPLKDLSAAKMAVRCGFKSRSGVVSEQGEDSERIDAEQESDNKRADQKKLLYDSDGRNAEKGNSGGRGESAGPTEKPKDDVDPVGEPKTGARALEGLEDDERETVNEMLADIIDGVKSIRGRNNDALEMLETVGAATESIKRSLAAVANAPPPTINIEHNPQPLNLTVHMPSNNKKVVFNHDGNGRVIGAESTDATVD